MIQERQFNVMEQMWSEFELCVIVNPLNEKEEDELRIALGEVDVQFLRGEQRIRSEPNDADSVWLVFHHDDFTHVLNALTHRGYKNAK
jgi:hypothetical protein